jgi:hypothetical protein
VIKKELNSTAILGGFLLKILTYLFKNLCLCSKNGLPICSKVYENSGSSWNTSFYFRNSEFLNRYCPIKKPMPRKAPPPAWITPLSELDG